MYKDKFLNSYLGAFLYRMTATKKNTILGSHAATMGGSPALTLKLAETVWKRK